MKLSQKGPSSVQYKREVGAHSPPSAPPPPSAPQAGNRMDGEGTLVILASLGPSPKQMPVTVSEEKADKPGEPGEAGPPVGRVSKEQ